MQTYSTLVLSERDKKKASQNFGRRICLNLLDDEAKKQFLGKEQKNK